MPKKTWTTQEEFEAGTLTDLVATGGTLALAEGENEGSWESEVYEAAAWAGHRKFRIAASQPEGTDVLFQFRTSSNPAALGDYTDPLDGLDADGNITFNLHLYLLEHEEITPGQYIQFKITLYGE